MVDERHAPCLFCLSISSFMNIEINYVRSLFSSCSILFSRSLILNFTLQASPTSADITIFSAIVIAIKQRVAKDNTHFLIYSDSIRSPSSGIVNSPFSLKKTPIVNALKIMLITRNTLDHLLRLSIRFTPKLIKLGVRKMPQPT